MQIEGRKIILELLEEGKSLQEIYIAEDIYKDEITEKIINLASKSTRIQYVSRDFIKNHQKSLTHQSMIAKFENLGNPHIAWKELLKKVDLTPNFAVFFVTDIEFLQNLGAILRTALGFKFDAVLVSNMGNKEINKTELIRISRGAYLKIPLIEISPMHAIKELKDNGVWVYLLDANTDSTIYNSDLKGPACFILGSESEGSSSKVEEKADHIIKIPIDPALESLNVSVTAGIIASEKRRQEAA